MVSRSKSTAKADPTLWSEKSQRSVSAEWTTEYRDIEYKCWGCQRSAVFTAQAQKHTFEVKKSPIDQRRLLCEECWHQSLEIAKEIAESERLWALDKPVLRDDRDFLSQWLKLLERREKYVPYRADIAKKNMLKKLLTA